MTDKYPLTRRRFVSYASALTGTAGSGLLAAAPHTNATQGSLSGSDRVFQHGVASGDPLSDRVILWTRVTVPTDAVTPVRWVIATDPDLLHPVNQGLVSALPARDHTVKVDALGLEPGRSYYYRFETDKEASDVGRTRTLPERTASRLRLAAASCANLPFGYFNAYAHIAKRSDLDLVLHLGDYLYEYAPNEYGNGSALGRVHYPPYEIISLSDYRARYAQYRTDADLQAAHRQHPWICVWDDHESSNNSWRDGAQNHNPELGEGSWSDRRRAAVQAYHEWLPIREQPSAAGSFIYRSFQLGDLASLIMLDTRLHGRSKQIAERTDNVKLNDATRTILGADQQAWLAEQLRVAERTGTTWKIIGQQLMFAQLIDDEGVLLNVDQWDGYPHSRDAVLEQLRAEHIDNTVILTGDIHSAWAIDVTPDPMGDGYDSSSGEGSLAVELITPSVTSPGPWRGDPVTAREREQAVVRDRPHIHYANFREHGYLLLDLDHTRAKAQWWFVDDILIPGGTEHLGASYVTERGANHLTSVA